MGLVRPTPPSLSPQHVHSHNTLPNPLHPILLSFVLLLLAESSLFLFLWRFLVRPTTVLYWEMNEKLSYSILSPSLPYPISTPHLYLLC